VCYGNPNSLKFLPRDGLIYLIKTIANFSLIARLGLFGVLGKTKKGAPKMNFDFPSF
jgi:hypothetical protein